MESVRLVTGQWLIFVSSVIMISHVEIQICDRLTQHQSAIFERVPLQHIRTRYSLAFATTTKVFMNNCSDMNPLYELVEKESILSAFTK